MQITAQNILLFGDQADAPVPMIRRVVEKARQSKNLEAFLQSAIDNVQIEVAKLTPPERESVGSFQSVQDLTLSLLNDTDRYGIARMVVVFIARIGELILHAENNPALLSSATPVVCLGICGGLLPAAAAAVATNVGELVEVSSYLAGINCRVAAAISRRSVQIEDDTAGSWAFSALGGVVQQLPTILDRFHRDHAIPRHRRAYVAVSTPTWATVFGPPSVLKKLFERSETLRTSETQLIPAFGAVHAAHLAAPDFADLVPGSNPLLNKPIKANFKLVSGSKYAPYPASTLKDLLPQTMLDIFQNGTNPARVFEVGGSFLQKGKEISLYMLGATSYLVLLRRSLHTQGFQVALKTNAPTVQNPEVRGGSGAVAIIGMSGKFPGAENMDELWELLMQGKEMHRKIPTERFDPDDFMDETGKSHSAITTPYGTFLDNPGLFDFKMFNVSPREAMQMDPGQRLLMHAVYEALEDAGVANNGTLATDSRRIGTYVGDASDDWRELLQPHGVDKYMVQGTQRSFTPGRLNHHFKWEGATFCVDSACGSTASAVGLAYRALVDRDVDTAIAGGSNIIATPFWQSALSKGGFLSPTGGSKTFREDADGYCRGEAIGAIVLKRLEDAVQDNDNIISVIRGYARNHSAEAVSITRPHVGAQERVYQALLHKTGLEANDISYVEMHGTGTTAGDSAELESVGNVLARKGHREKPLLVGAIKANLGHGEAASGISSIMKAAIMFRKGLVPPQPGIPHKMAKYPSLEQSYIHIPGAPVPYTRESVGKKRTMLVSNFDAAGGNSCFILEEPPLPSMKTADPRTHHIITVSGHSPVSLEGNKRRLLDFLSQNIDSVNLADLAYTTTARRMHHSLRSAYSGGSIQDIIDRLSKDLSKAPSTKAVPGSAKTSKVVFTFTGQGAHYAGMGGDLFESSPPFRATITGLQRVCASHGFPSFVHLISNPDANIERATTVQIHLALVALEIALVDLWKTWGITPDLVIGHSIGEYAALYAAGVLSATDAMYLVGKRALLVQDTCKEGTHGMLSISGTPDDVASILSDKSIMSAPCEVACHNSPGMVVLSGERSKLVGVERVLESRKIKSKLLDVPYAMHSHQMDVILTGLRKVADGVRFGPPRVKVISTLLGVGHDQFGSEYLVRHTREPVKFEQAINHCVSQGLLDPSTALWLEIGPNPVCLGLARSNIVSELSTDRALASLKKGEGNWKSVSAILATWYRANRAVRWREFHSDYATNNNLSLVALPKYAFDTRDFWMPYTHVEIENGSQTQSKNKSDISTCLQKLVSQEDNGIQQSATFTALLQQSSLAKMIDGHKLSGITVCPAGVFSDMALTAARYLLTNGNVNSSTPYPRLSILDTQIDHPVMPKPGRIQLLQLQISRHHQKSPNTFTVEISESSNPSVVSTKCIVTVQDPNPYSQLKQSRLSSILPAIASLRESAASGLANRFQQKLFYKLFNNVMDYTGLYEGVREAIVSEDFTAALATVQVPAGSPTNPDFADSTTLSPYWMDALGHLAGFLLNGNPLSSSGQDFVYIGTHMGRMDVDARDFQKGANYLSYAFVEPEDKSKTSSMADIWRGNVYLLDEHGKEIIGIYEGLRFRRMTRGTLHKILGKPLEVTKSKKLNGISHDTSNINGVNGHAVNGVNGHAVNGVVNGTNGANGTNGHYEAPSNVSGQVNGHANGIHGVAINGTPKKKSVYQVLVGELLEETGMEEGDLTPETFFAEIGVESLMSISILAAVKAKTGVELSAAFLMEYPTLEDARRELRKFENQNDSPAEPQQEQIQEVKTNGHTNGHTNGIPPPPPPRDCNIVLMQGPSTTTSTPSSSTQPPLFLIADGAGSAAAYIHLPKISPTQSVYAIESPYVTDPENFTPDIPFSTIISSYLNAIRSKQPHGPYLLGGWSAGGVFSYEVARQLLESGERVLGLIIIDITAPRAEDKSRFTPPTMEIIDQIGMLSGIERTFDDTGVSPAMAKESLRLKRHMLSTVTLFSQMDPVGMSEGRKPDWTFVIWARKDILPKKAMELLPKGLDAWFYPTSHVEVGPYGWDKLVGETGERLDVRQIEGDHFSIMTLPEVTQLGDIVKEAVAKCVA